MTDQNYMKEGFVFATGKLVEELGELQMALGKMMRFGLLGKDPTLNEADQVTNINQVLNETKDVIGAIRNFQDEWDRLPINKINSVFGVE